MDGGGNVVDVDVMTVAMLVRGSVFLVVVVATRNAQDTHGVGYGHLGPVVRLY